MLVYDTETGTHEMKTYRDVSNKLTLEELADIIELEGRKNKGNK